jgi:hypothetical protein
VWARVGTHTHARCASKHISTHRAHHAYCRVFTREGQAARRGLPLPQGQPGAAGWGSVGQQNVLKTQCTPPTPAHTCLGLGGAPSTCRPSENSRFSSTCKGVRASERGGLGVMWEAVPVRAWVPPALDWSGRAVWLWVGGGWCGRPGVWCCWWWVGHARARVGRRVHPPCVLLPPCVYRRTCRYEYSVETYASNAPGSTWSASSVCR